MTTFAEAWDAGRSSEAVQIVTQDRLREVETVLWKLTYALYDEKAGNSAFWPAPIRNAMIEGRRLTQHLDVELHPYREQAAALASEANGGQA